MATYVNAGHRQNDHLHACEKKMGYSAAMERKTRMRKKMGTKREEMRAAAYRVALQSSFVEHFFRGGCQIWVDVALGQFCPEDVLHLLGGGETCVQA